MIINSKHVGGGADPVINPLTVTENGTYTASEGVDGFNPVTVDAKMKKVRLTATQDVFEWQNVLQYIWQAIPENATYFHAILIREGMTHYFDAAGDFTGQLGEVAGTVIRPFDRNVLLNTGFFIRYSSSAVWSKNNYQSGYTGDIKIGMVFDVYYSTDPTIVPILYAEA